VAITPFTLGIYVQDILVAKLQLAELKRQQALLRILSSLPLSQQIVFRGQCVFFALLAAFLMTLYTQQKSVAHMAQNRSPTTELNIGHKRGKKSKFSPGGGGG
jgi:hypothetical protein